jgi:Flp pilus assembly protein TadD
MKIRVLCFSVFILAAFCISPGWAGDDQSEKQVVSEQTIADIERAMSDGRYLDAGRMLDEVALSSADDARVVVLAGELALARGRAADALERFKSVDTAATVQARALQGEGIALAALGKADEAIPILQKAVAENAQAWRAWNALGVLLDQRHDWNAAELAFAHAIDTSGSSPIVLNNRGFSRLCQNRPEDAMADFVQALQKKPDFASARNNLRLAMAMQGDYDRAVAGISPAERAAALNNAGYVAMLRGDYARAKALLAQSMKAKGEYYSIAADNLSMTESLEAGRTKAPTALDASHN